MGIFGKFFGQQIEGLKQAKFESYAIPAVKHYTGFDVEKLSMKLQNEIFSEALLVIDRVTVNPTNEDFTACYFHAIILKSPFGTLDEAARFYSGWGVFIHHSKSSINPLIKKALNLGG